MARLNVVIINDWISNLTSGGTYRIQGFAQGLTMLGHNVFIITPWGITKYENDMHVYQPNLGSPLYYFTTFALLPINTLRLLEKTYGVDLVIIQMPSPITKPLTILPILKSKSIPVILDFGDPWWSRKSPWLYIKIANYIIKKEIQNSVLVSSSSKLLLKALAKSIDSKVPMLYIPNGVDSRVFKPIGEGNSSVIGLLGRFNARNGSRLIIPILKRLVSRIPDIKFLLIGDGEDLQLIINDAYKAGLNKNIIVKGPLPRYRIPEELSRAGILIAPYSDDPTLHFIFPTKVPEMMALKRPVITAPLYEILTSFKNGKELLIARNNPDSYANKILTLFNNTELSKIIAMNGYATIMNNYTWDKLIKLLLNKYIAL